jgi:hypothetical protein
MAYTTINKQTDYFNTKLYTGNGSTQNITGVGFQPDWTWIKNRADTDWHFLTDAVRGVTKTIHSNTNNAESTQAAALTAFGTDGFSVGNDAAVNANSENIVAWNWKAGTGQGSSNTDGSINTTYTSANTTAGFSICSYTGTGSNATIGHGLGVAPQVVLIKELNGTNNWIMSHQPLSASLGDYTRYMTLNSTGAVSGAGNVLFQSSAFTSSVFNVGTSAATNGSGQNFIAYCFASKTGYSKFGAYTGNGNANGTFIYTGFKPSWVMIKNTSASNDWFMIDNSRDTLSPNNPVGRKSLEANDNAAEVTRTTKDMDFLSNGIKLKTADGTQNNSGQNYIYMAFGQSIVGTNNIPATAR